MEKFYRTLLKRTFEITWKYKWLWVFGFFATFLANGTLYETIWRSYTDLAEGRSIFFTFREYVNSGLFSMFSWTRLMDQLSTDPGAFTISVFTMVIMAAFIAVFIVLAVVSQAGLIKSAVSLDLKKKVTFRQAFMLGIDKFWPVIMLNFVMRVLLWGGLLVVALLVSLMVLQGNMWNYVLYGISFVMLLLLGTVAYFMTIYATAFVVLRDKSVLSSLRLAWYVFKQNVLLNLEVALILMVVNVLMLVVMGVVALLVISPFVLIYIMMVIMSAVAGLGFIKVIITLLIIASLVVMGSLFTTFQISLWSILFEELALKRATSKTERVVHAIVRHVQKRRK